MKHFVLIVVLAFSLFAKDDIKSSFNNNKDSIITIVYEVLGENAKKEMVNNLAKKLLNHMQSTIEDFKKVDEKQIRYLKEILSEVKSGKNIDEALKQKDEQIAKLQKEIVKLQKGSDEILKDILKRATKALSNYELDNYHTILSEYEQNKTIQKTLKGVAKTYYLRASQYYESGYYKKAQYYINKAVVNDEKNAQYLNLNGMVLAKHNNFKEAEKAYGKALSLYRALAKTNPNAYNPNVATTLNNLAVLYYDQNRLKEAERFYDEALSLRRALAKTNPNVYNPDVADTLNNLGLLYSAQNRLKEAEKAYGKALSLYRALP